MSRRNNSSSTVADNIIPQVSSLAPSVATADSLIVTARTTTKELQPNIFNLDDSFVKTQNLDNLSRRGPSSDNLSTKDQQQTEKMVDQLSEGVTDTVINLKGSVKKYMEIVRNNSTKSEEESPATTTTPAAGRTTAAESSEVTSTAKMSTTPSVVVTTTPVTTKMYPKKTSTVRSTTSPTAISSSTRPSTTARTTTESANTRFATEEPPNTERNEQEIGISTDSSGLKKEASPVLDLEVEDGQVAPPVSRVVKNIDEDAGEATKRGGQLENQLDSALPVPARPLVLNRTNQEGLQADFPGRPDLPRQREELKKDLLEAIKRKISKNRPGGDERSHQGRHKLFHTSQSLFVSRRPDNDLCY